jgi:hypothetical protein
MSKSETHTPRLTGPLLDAIKAALDAALAGEGFDGGDFDGMNRDHFERASKWVEHQITKRGRHEYQHPA